MQKRVGGRFYPEEFRIGFDRFFEIRRIAAVDIVKFVIEIRTLEFFKLPVGAAIKVGRGYNVIAGLE
jgi:hypothetical protein